MQANPSDQAALYHLIQALRKAGKTAELPGLVKRLATLRAQGEEAQAAERRVAPFKQTGTVESARADK